MTCMYIYIVLLLLLLLLLEESRRRQVLIEVKIIDLIARSLVSRKKQFPESLEE